MARLSLILLGSFQVTLDGHPVTAFATDKARALLAYLAVERDRPHRREALAALLWPDQPEPRARQNFRQTLSYLRQALCDTSACPFLWVERNEVQLNPTADVHVDVAEFTALDIACENHRHRSREQCLPCLRRAETQIELYRGEFLAGFMLADSNVFEEWAQLQREWLHIRAVESLSQLADFYERRNDINRACREVKLQVQLEPWREESHRQLMRLLALSGQRSAALAQYETCRRILHEEFDAEPTAETTRLWSKLKTEAPELEYTGGVSPLHRRPQVPQLPLPLSTFVGRETELCDLTELLANPLCRLATLTGPGGIGKTRLALQLAGDHIGLYADGVVWVALDTIHANELIIPTIAQSLDFMIYGTEPPQTQLLNYLRSKKILIVLDNAEHLTGISTVIEALLQHAPGVTLLVTSRERLALQEEWVFAVEGLTLPDGRARGTPDESVRQADAMALFIQHARRVHRHFAPNSDELAEIVEICRLVEGMPLALEMAAASVDKRSCADIAGELSAGLDMLQTTLRNMPDRRRSMRATFEHSWTLLSTTEQQIFARLAVFRGSFTAQAAQTVTGATEKSLTSLVNKSLVRHLPNERYQLHGLLRQFAADKLDSAADRSLTAIERVASAGRTPTPAARHAAYYAEVLAEHESALKGAGQDSALIAITADIANVRGAWEWAVSSITAAENVTPGTATSVEPGTAAAETALSVIQSSMESLFLFVSLRSWYQEGAGVFARAAMAVGEKKPLLLGELLTRQARCSEFTAPTEEATTLYARSLAIFQELGAEQEAALPLYGLGYMAHLRGDYAMARTYFMTSISRYETSGDRWSLANVLSSLCLSLRRQGVFQEARDFGMQSLAIRRELGDRRGVASSQNNIGLVQCAMGDYTAAETALSESLVICREIGHTVGAANTLTSLCHVALSAGDTDRAARYQREALELFREVGDLWGVAIALNNLGQITLEHGDASAARVLLQESAMMYRQAGVKAGLTNALSNLGWACDVLGETAEAAQHLHEALALALELNELPFGLEALTRAAALLVHRTPKSGQDQAIRAVAVLAFVQHHPSLLEETRRAAAEIQARIQDSMSADAVAAADRESIELEIETAATEVMKALTEISHTHAHISRSGDLERSPTH